MQFFVVQEETLEIDLVLTPGNTWKTWEQPKFGLGTGFSAGIGNAGIAVGKGKKGVEEMGMGEIIPKVLG